MKLVLDDPALPKYNRDAKFGIPSDFDYCERPKGLAPRNSDVMGGGGARRGAGASGAAAQASGNKATRREEPHKAENMQGAFD